LAPARRLHGFTNRGVGGGWISLSTRHHAGRLHRRRPL